MRRFWNWLVCNLAWRLPQRSQEETLRLPSEVGRNGTETSDLAAFIERGFNEYLRANPGDEYARKAFSFDKVRFKRSLEWLLQVDLSNKRVLDLGGYGVSSYLIEHLFPTCWYQVTDFDLRQTFPYPDDTFDVVIAMEVIEHICDLQYAHATTLSGVRHCLAESFRVLQPGGKLFLTTPNASSLWIIQRALLHQPPWLYEYHFREFTFEEIRMLVEAVGFRLLKAATEQVWHFWDFGPLVGFLRDHGYSLDHRGDDTFLLAEKPKASEP